MNRPVDGVEQSRRRLAYSCTVLLAALTATCLGWAVDSAVSSDTVARNVHVRGTDLSGMTAAGVRSVATTLTEDLAGQPVVVSVGERTVTTDLVRLGARVDHERLVASAYAARTDGPWWTGPFRWLGSFATPVELDLPYVVDADTVEAAVAGFIAPQLDGPRPPTVTASSAGFSVEEGRDGIVVDPAQLAERVVGVIGRPGPHRFSLTPYPQRPELGLDAVGRVAAELNLATADPLEVRVLDQETILEPAELRALIDVENTAEGAFWEVNQGRAVDLLRDRFERLGDENQQARFIVVQDVPQIVPADETIVCCDDKTAALLRAALATRPSEPTAGDDPPEDREPGLRSVELNPIITDGERGVAELEALGITELVSTFTTNHPCCQSRVTNIQLFADTMRGTVIEPGEVLSLNGLVGPRTAEKGYVAAGAINLGSLEPQVGGGVSQVATTTFNAAFFAGLDFVEYQAHSLYFDRYPYGREATISSPRPDLKIANNTPFGVLIWTEYTPTSITVSMYSTKHIEVEDLGTTTRSQGLCRRATTTRQRTYGDGRVETDEVFAVYRPGEGLDCNGNPTQPVEEDDAPPTTAATPSTTATGPAPTTTTTVPTPTTTTAAVASTTTTAATSTTTSTVPASSATATEGATGAGLGVETEASPSE